MTNMTKIKNWLIENHGEIIAPDEPMSRHTTFRTGGPCDIFVRPKDRKTAVEIINRLNRAEAEFFVIGGGSNILVSDSGIRGVVISLGKIDENITLSDAGDHVILSAGAGIKTHEVCSFAVSNGLSGMNFALGIPGTLGGAVSMNAGTASGEMKDVINSVTLLNGSGELRKIKRDALSFSYRKLDWGNQSPAPVIFGADIRLVKGDPVAVKAEADTIISRRRKSQPVSQPNAGCIFKNPDSENPAGKLIDLAGLKGKRAGGAMISDRHANFIVNTGNARSADIMELISLAKEKVYKNFNIMLETEVKIVD